MIDKAMYILAQAACHITYLILIYKCMKNELMEYRWVLIASLFILLVASDIPFTERLNKWGL